MSPDQISLSLLAEAVADGKLIDWEHAESSASSPDDRQVVEHLRQLARVAQAARALASAWGPLQIRAEVGGGTFGTVHRAWYPRLECEVALKLLHEEHPRIKEACLLAQIRHPNVVTVYGADTIDGRTGIWMEFISGQTLKEILKKQGPFGPDEAALIGRDLCRALAAVHQKDFLHRDIKAQNVMREAGGRTVLMDFGAGDVLSGEGETAEKSLAGSPAYLAPEVLAGGRPSVRSDLYSLGVLLYHLVTGTFPVTGGSLRELREAHAKGQRRLLRDARPDLPAPFVRAVDRSIAMNPADRPESAGAMELLLEGALGLGKVEPSSTHLTEIGIARPSKATHAALAWRTAAIVLALTVVVTGWVVLRSATTSTPARPVVGTVHAITVAPFDLKNGSASWATIASAMTADIANDLEGPGLVVKGRVLPAVAGDDARRAQAETLGADAVVRGTLTVMPDELVLDVGIFQTASRQSLWQQTFRAAPSQAASLPHRISAEIATVLGFDPMKARAAESRTVSLEAYDHYARGKQLAEQREPTALDRSIKQFEEAIKLEPSYAPAWAGLADAWIALGVPAFGPLRPYEARGRAREAALKALDLDPNLAEAHTALAFLSYFHDWNWSAADERFQRALRLNPNDAEAHHWYADFLNAMGRFAEATEHINIACALEPLSILYQRDVAWHLFFQRKYGAAIVQLRHTLDLDPSYGPAISLLGRALVQDGQYDAGIAELHKLDLKNPANEAMLAYAYAAAGDRNQAVASLSRIHAQADTQYVSPYSIALVEAALGDRDGAIEKLINAFDEQDSTIVNLRVDPRFDGLRNDPRFRQLIVRLRYPDVPEVSAK